MGEAIHAALPALLRQPRTKGESDVTGALAGEN